MMWIGLTGGIASGKSTVSNYLKAMGHAVADADQYAHQALQPGTDIFKRLIQHFGPEVLDSTGLQIDRRELGKRVFQNETERLFLESLVHPFVQKKVQEARADWENEGRDFAFYDVPLLFEKKLEVQFDLIVLVATEEALQKQRMKLRNSWSDKEIQDRLSSQMPMEMKRKHSQFVIENTGSIEDLEKNVRAMLAWLNKIKVAPDT